MKDKKDGFGDEDLDAREIYANILLSFLHHKKYINLQTKDNKYFGIALRKIMRDDFEEYIIILLELFQGGGLLSQYKNPESVQKNHHEKLFIIDNKEYVKKYSDVRVPMTGKKLNKDEEEAIRMISR